MNKPEKRTLIDMAYVLNIESDEDCTAFYEYQQRLIDEHIKKPIEELLASGLITNFDDEEYQEYLNG